MNPRQGNVWLRRLTAVIGAMAIAAASAPAASADESATPTAQARAYNADWVPYLDPPEKPAAVCLVDSGVNITPDTPADSPEGPIVKRLALDGGPGTAANSTWEGLHGTRMAMVGAAPINDWGAVGFWPGVRIVSIRAMPVGATGFPFDDYSRAILLCNKETRLNVAAVNLALDCDCQPTASERTRLDLQIANAHDNGASVVGAAGNSGEAVGNPADAAGVLATAAGDVSGTLCFFSNRGPEVDLVAPGCNVALADPGSGELWPGYNSGTSGASTTASVVLALLRSYRPDLAWRRAEELLTQSARTSASGPVLDVEALFRAAGLATLVNVARARMPSPSINPASASIDPGLAQTVSSADPEAATAAPTRRQAGAPRLKSVRRRGERITVIVRNFPHGAQLAVSLQTRRSEFRWANVARFTRTTSRVTLRLPPRWPGGRLALRFEIPGRRHHASPFVYRGLAR